MMMRSIFEVECSDDLSLHADEALLSMYTLSPFVWIGDQLEILLRAVNHAPVAEEKVARIYHGRSLDGLQFVMDALPAIAPGPREEDRDGCEDPTVVLYEKNMFVFYTGWNQQRLVGELLMAKGASADSLRKTGVAVPSTERWKNPKEATVVRQDDGTWRLFFEYAKGDASRIGVGVSRDLEGDWSLSEALIDVRPDQWDSWHLSPGPIIDFHGQPLMFYNGATKDANWRIGWVLFDANYSKIESRCDAPLIVPPPAQGEDTDIAFAASAIQLDGAVWLYYSLADKRMKRAVLRSNKAL